MPDPLQCEICKGEPFKNAAVLAAHMQACHGQPRGEGATDDRDYLKFDVKMGGMEGKGEIYFESKEEKSARGKKTPWADFFRTIGAGLIATAEKLEGEEGK